jgi:hypothetical protein
MHHRAALIFTRAETSESFDFDIIIVSITVRAPFYRDQAMAQILQWLWRAKR